MSKAKVILILFFIDIFFFVTYFLLKIYFQPIAIVAPHHNVVAQKRLEFFQKIASKRLITKKIIIIGPDHFSRDQREIYYSNNDWNLNNGNLQFEKKIESKLSQYLSLQNGIVKNDHAIYNLLPDIKSVWPNSQIFPILIGQNYPISKLDNLISKIETICNFDCLLISSVDFSHYLPAALANVHDQKSIYDLSIQNLEEISKLEVDSPQSLYVLAKYSQFKNAKKWDLFYHSNSGELVNSRDIESTSHVLGSYSRSFFNKKIPDIKTFILTNDIDQKINSNSLGIRFFYGTDYTNSSIPIDLNNIPKKNLVIAGWKTDTNSQLVFLPTETNKGITFLLKGEKKDFQLKELFKNLKLDFKFTLDLKNGIINF